MAKSRRVTCPCCERGRMVKMGQVWSQRLGGGELRIVSAERDGAIVEQVGREKIDPRWGVSYADLQESYVLGRSGGSDG